MPSVSESDSLVMEAHFQLNSKSIFMPSYATSIPGGRFAHTIGMTFLVGLVREVGAPGTDGLRNFHCLADSQVSRMRLVA